jgi:aminopeptidase-like protein
MSQGILQNFQKCDPGKLGDKLYGFAADLFPVCRSITGEGIRETLKAIQRRIPLDIHEVPTGTEVFDWIVPKEWNIRDAYIKDSAGKRVVDFRASNLHVVNYSTPVRQTMSFVELNPHLHSIAAHPDRIPYRTSYYKEDWGFCLSENQRKALADSQYEVCIDSSLKEGSLTYGECFLKGATDDEILVSVHACHPSLANDNLSGLTVATALAELVHQSDHRYSYRFLFLPGTIGAITWLSLNPDRASRIRHGLVLTCVGDRGGFHYKKSRRGDAEIDSAMAHVLRHCGESSEILDFSPYGYDERQYCSPGFNLPVGCLMRSVWGTFPEYHTSADNLDFISPEQLARSVRLCVHAFDVIEQNATFINRLPFCEPQLGKRNLYRTSGGESIDDAIHARLWVLNFSDGNHSLLEIAERSGLPFSTLRDAAEMLQSAGLLEISPGESPDDPRKGQK